MGFLIWVNAVESKAEHLLFSMPDDSIARVSLLVLQEAYESLDIQINVEMMPAARSLNHANRGLSDGEVSRIAGIDQAFPNLVQVEVPINVLEGVIFTTEKELESIHWQALKPFTIGIRKGIRFAEEGTRGMRVEFAKNNEQLFRKLVSGRTDFVVTSLLEGLYEINRLQLYTAYPLKPPLVRHYLYHYLYRKHFKLVPRLTEVLKRMEQSGRIQEIRQQALKNLALPLTDVKSQ